MLCKVALLSAIALFAIGTTYTTTANATQLLPKHHRIRDLPLRNQANWYRKNIRHARATLRWWSHERNVLVTSSVRRQIVNYHVRLLRNSKRQLRSIVRSITLLAEPAYLRSYPIHVTEWNCIHNYEGSWTDPNAPYYGGLQMDWDFMSAYGLWLLERKGTADHWTPLEQMQVAENALSHGRGFYPWPNSARMCGLI